MRCSISRIEARIEEFLQHPDLQSLERLLERGAVVGHRQLDAGGIALIEAGHRTQQQRRILGAARDQAALIQARGEGDHAVARHAAIGGLEPGHAAQRRRLADRAAGVGGGGRRHQPGGHRRRRAAGGAARHARDVPGIAHRAEVAGLVGRAHRELVHVGLAEHDHAGGPQALDHRGIVGRDEIRQHARAAGGLLAAGAEDVLVGDRHAGQRRRLACRAAAHRPLPPRASAASRGDADEGIELALMPRRCASRKACVSSTLETWRARSAADSSATRLVMQLAHSITRGTRYRPASTCGALRW